MAANGAGAFQLRVGQPPGSTERLVTLDAPLAAAQPYRVDLFEAQPTDPAAPCGKAFARLSCAELGVLDHGGARRGGAGRGGSLKIDGRDKQSFGGHARRREPPRSRPLPLVPPADKGGDSGAEGGDDNVTYLLNSQSIEALAFRIDVTSVHDGALLARGFVTHLTLQQREGTVNVALLTPQLQHAGTFRASFLVISEFPHPRNNLGNLQRKRWLPNEPMLDIG